MQTFHVDDRVYMGSWVTERQPGIVKQVGNDGPMDSPIPSQTMILVRWTRYTLAWEYPEDLRLAPPSLDTDEAEATTR